MQNLNWNYHKVCLVAVVSIQLYFHSCYIKKGFSLLFEMKNFFQKKIKNNGRKNNGKKKSQKKTRRYLYFA